MSVVSYPTGRAPTHSTEYVFIDENFTNFIPREISADKAQRIFLSVQEATFPKIVDILKKNQTNDVITIIIGNKPWQRRIFCLWKSDCIHMFSVTSRKFHVETKTLIEGNYKTGRDVKLSIYHPSSRYIRTERKPLILMKNKKRSGFDGLDATKIFQDQRAVGTPSLGLEAMEREKKFLRAFQGTLGILQLKGSFTYVNKEGLSRISLVFEKLRTNLADAISKNEIPSSKILEIQLSLVKLLCKIHEQGWVHRDVKLENILLDDSFSPWIIDFGLAHKMGDPITTIGGSLMYIAPEMADAQLKFEGSILDERGHELKKHIAPAMDIYALGIVFSIMHKNIRKFEIKESRAELLQTRAELYRKALSNPEDNPSFEAIFDIPSLIEKMTEPNPEKRITARKAVKYMEDIIQLDEITQGMVFS